MKHAGTFILVLFLGSMVLTIQSFGQGYSESTALTMMRASTDCPIVVDAVQSGVGEMLPINSGGAKGPAQQLHIIVTNTKSVEIVAARITVHGFTGKGRFLHLQSTQDNFVDATKTFDLVLRVGAKEDASTDLLLHGFTAVGLVNLDSVTYADGSSWHSSDSKTCHINFHTSVQTHLIVRPANALPY